MSKAISKAVGYPAFSWECPECEEPQHDDGRGGTCECIGCGKTFIVEVKDTPQERLNAILRHLAGSTVHQEEASYFGVCLPKAPEGAYRNTATEFLAAVDRAVAAPIPPPYPLSESQYP